MVIDHPVRGVREIHERGERYEAGCYKTRCSVQQFLPDSVHNRDHEDREDRRQITGSCNNFVPGGVPGDQAEHRGKERVQRSPVDQLSRRIRRHRVEPVVLREMVDHHFDLTQGVPGVRIIHREKSQVPRDDCRKDPEHEGDHHEEKEEQDDEGGLVFFTGSDIHCWLILMNR